MLRRFQNLLQTVLTGPRDSSPSAEADELESPGPLTPPMISECSARAICLPQVISPMGPLPSEQLRPTWQPPNQPISALTSETPQGLSLTEICAEQPLTPLLRSLHEQVRWFYEYRPTDSRLYPTHETGHLSCQPLAALLDYQRLQIRTEGLPYSEIELMLEVMGPGEAMLKIGDIQPGTFEQQRLQIPCNQPIEICFRILSPSKGPFALRLIPRQQGLQPVTSPICFPANQKDSYVSVA